MDVLVEKIAALGVPGLVLYFAIGATGLSGAAAITCALSAIGPGGMIGGLITLGFIGVITDGIAEFGFDYIFSAVMKELYNQGETKESIIYKIENYRITKKLKLKLIKKITDLADETES